MLDLLLGVLYRPAAAQDARRPTTDDRRPTTDAQ
jgi:hypothetical protein